MATTVGPEAMMQGGRYQIMPRPAGNAGYGTAGRRIRLEVNFFRARVQGLTTIHQHDVAIFKIPLPPKEPSPRGVPSPGFTGGAGGQQLPDPPLTDAVFNEDKDVASTNPIEFNRTLVKRAVQQRQFKGVAFAYDGRKIGYTAQDFDNKAVHARLLADKGGYSPEESKAKNGFPSKIEYYHVAIKATSTHDARRLNDPAFAPTQDIVNALDVVLAEGLHRNHVPVGRSFYNPQHKTPIGEGCSIWSGIYQSMRKTHFALCVNMDTSLTAFYDEGQTMMDLAVAVNEGYPVHMQISLKEFRDVEDKLKGVRMRAVHTGIHYMFHGFNDNNAHQIQFEDQRLGRKISVAQYMEQMYNVRLKHAEDWPCVKVHPTKDSYVPIELLMVAEKQRRRKALSSQQTMKMIRAANVRPGERRHRILAAMRAAAQSRDGSSRAFGISVDNEMIKCEGRQLDPPNLTYRDRANNRTVLRPRDGAWMLGNNQYLLETVPLERWMVINNSRTRIDDVGRFMEDLMRFGQNNNFRMARPFFPRVAPRGIAQFRSGKEAAHFLHAERENIRKLQLIMIINDQDTYFYNYVKTTADLDIGVATQFILAKNLRPRSKAALYANILLKINAKLGGVNVRASNSIGQAGQGRRESNHRMILGADVTHPGAGATKKPSIAALVASMDTSYGQYAAAIQNQSPREELLRDIKRMFTKLLNQFRARNDGYVPESLVFFRDGVSEGQFQQVLDHEYAELKAACTDFHPDYHPKVTMIIVAKRHHARFFPLDRRDQDRSGNVKAGLVVDRDVTNPERFDFYMATHAGIQGTSRPAKYTVLRDENNFSVDELQKFIYEQTHTYARCTRSVSIVSSAYYAHLLATRARVYADHWASEHPQARNSDQVPPTGQIHQNLSSKLFFI